MKFSKLQGAGNDFIIINNMEEKIPVEQLGSVAAQLCRRKRSIGADGLMAVDAPEAGGDFKMRFFNADGSEGEMCGNGARCIARYGWENGLAGEIQHIETMAGMVEARRINTRMYQIRLNDPTTIRLGQKAEIDGKEYFFSYVELGDPGLPHAVVELPEFLDMEENALRELGRKLWFYEAFPKGANVNFYAVTESDTVQAKTFERGVEDFTLACGTGAGSIAAALTLSGKVSGRVVRINMPGGSLSVIAECNAGEVTGLYLIGLTNMVAQGEVTDEDFLLERLQ